MRFVRLALLASALAASALGAQEAWDPASALGREPEAVYRDLGAPSEVFPVPVDATRWQVAHFYPQFFTLYWYANHVWQVRLDRRYAGLFQGVSMGLTRAQVELLLGPPQAAGTTEPVWLAWQLPFQGFPRGLRLVFENDLLVEASFYRSDL